MFFDSRRKDVKVIDGMFCEYHIGDVSQNIVDANQMFIDFRKVSAMSNEEAYAKLHEKHKEEFAKKVSHLPLSEKELNELGFEKPQEGDTSDVIEFNTEPATEAEQKALDDINWLSGHKNDKHESD